MARTRDRYLKQTDKESQPKSLKKWRAGIYTRISVDRDGEKRESLETQKLIAVNFAETQPDIEIIKFYEDDGISGTKFDRENFVRMINDIKSKEINTVIVKDLSRFGRNLEEVSNYIEKIFPFMQVRFISVNDNYDSISPQCDNQMLGIMISNLANDLYAKDASIKSSSTMAIRMQSGEYCGGNAPYGYKKGKDKNGKLITVRDPLTAPYAIMIFQKIAKGQSYLSISREFNEMLLSTPKYYAKTGKLFMDNICETNTHWCASTIKKIAENKHYLGNTYNHKTRTSLLTQEKNTILDESEWNEYMDTHEALVSEELFEKVQSIMNKKHVSTIAQIDSSTMETYGKKENKYIGLLFCGECGAKMNRNYSRKLRNGVLYYKYYYICNNYVNVSKNSYSCNRWTEEVLDELVYHAILKQLKVIVDIKNQMKKFNKVYYQPYIRHLCKEHSKIIQLNEKNETRRLELYEQYVSGEIDTDEYNCSIERLSVIKKELETRLFEIEKNKKKTERLSMKNFQWMNDFLKAKNINYLTKEVVSSYIKRINLYENRRIEIEFKFQDELMKLAEELEGGIAKCKMISA